MRGTLRYGLSIQGLFLGAFAHSDDIRTTATNPDDTDERVKTVASFADRNGLKLSTEKCGIVSAGRVGMDPPLFLWLVSQLWSLSSVLAFGGALTPPARSLLKNIFAKHAELSLQMVIWVPSIVY